jgi:predicted nuclease with TOPRIM domain
LVDKNESLKENIQGLEYEKEEVYEKVRNLYDQKDEVRDKFLAMDEHVQQKNKELSAIETKLQKAKRDYEPSKSQEELNLIHELFPMMREQLRIADLCQKIGLTVESIKSLFATKKVEDCRESDFIIKQQQISMSVNYCNSTAIKDLICLKHSYFTVP